MDALINGSAFFDLRPEPGEVDSLTGSYSYHKTRPWLEFLYTKKGLMFDIHVETIIARPVKPAVVGMVIHVDISGQSIC